MLNNNYQINPDFFFLQFVLILGITFWYISKVLKVCTYGSRTKFNFFFSNAASEAVEMRKPRRGPNSTGDNPEDNKKNRWERLKKWISENRNYILGTVVLTAAVVGIVYYLSGSNPPPPPPLNPDVSKAFAERLYNIDTELKSVQTPAEVLLQPATQVTQIITKVSQIPEESRLKVLNAITVSYEKAMDVSERAFQEQLKLLSEAAASQKDGGRPFWLGIANALEQAANWEVRSEVYNVAVNNAADVFSQKSFLVSDIADIAEEVSEIINRACAANVEYLNSIANIDAYILEAVKKTQHAASH